MIQQCCQAAKEYSHHEDLIKCFSFYTDGGAYQDSNTYFLYRLQGDGKTLYSTIKIPDTTKRGVNIQVYMGREAEYGSNMYPASYRVVKNSNTRIRLPIKQCLCQPDEQETFKMLTKMQIDKQCTGYTCFVHTYAVFVSDKEVDCENSNVLQAFAGVDSIQKFLNMKLDLVRYSHPDSSSDDISTLKPSTTKSTVIEIDLSKPLKLKKNLHYASLIKMPKLDCYPLLWCQQEKLSQIWEIIFKQKIAAKYVVIKLISRAPGSSSYDANLDMFPLHFHGIKLPIPCDSQVSSELPEFADWHLPGKDSGSSQSKKSLDGQIPQYYNLNSMLEKMTQLAIPLKDSLTIKNVNLSGDKFEY